MHYTVVTTQHIINPITQFLLIRRRRVEDTLDWETRPDCVFHCMNIASKFTSSSKLKYDNFYFHLGIIQLSFLRVGGIDN